VASSSSVYGGSDGRPCAEDRPLRPRGGYARSKVLAEALCRHRAETGGRVVVARPFTVAGEGQRPDMVISRWLRAAAAGRPLCVLGSPERTRDITDVADVVRALRASVTSGASGTVNIGTGTGHTLRAVADAVAAALDVDVHLDLVPASRVEPPATLADTRRLHGLAGFVPHTDLPALVARQARHAAATGATGQAARAPTPVAP
ncbi:MAG: NAD-dependent epimerase/dehydratase family protein, partial [Actinomycetes bacterium]